MLIKKVLSSLTLFCASFLFSQTVTSTFDDFTIADCVSTPCQDIIVEGGLDGLSFKYIDCNCNTTGVYIPKGKVYVLKALVGKIEVAQGAFNPTGVISQPVSNTLYVEALEELIQTSFGSINNSIDHTQQNLCIGEQPATITGYEGQFFDFDIFYSWLKSTDNINFSYIRGARTRDYTPEVLNETTYFKRQVFTAVSTGTYSEVVKVAVSSCDDNCVISPTYSQGSISQTVTESTALPTTTIDFAYTCDDALVIEVTGLPPGIESTINADSITLFGTPSSQASGAYNYSIVASNTSFTASETVTGVVTITRDCSSQKQLIDSFVDYQIGDTYDFGTGDYIVTAKYGGSTPQSGVLSGITYKSVRFSSNISDSNSIWVQFEYREDNDEFLFVYTGRRDESQSNIWSYIKYHYSPNYQPDLSFPGNYYADNFCDTWQVLTDYILTIPQVCNFDSSVTAGSISQTVTESTSIATTTVAFTLSCSETINILASGLPLGIQTEVTSNSITLFGTPSELATGLFNFSLVASSTSASTSYTVTGTIEVIEGPNVPTQVRPHLLPSIFISPLIEDNVGETFIGPFNATTSPTLKEGQKYYNIKHQQDEED